MILDSFCQSLMNFLDEHRIEMKKVLDELTTAKNLIFSRKILGCEIQDVSTSILKMVSFEEMTGDDEDESSKHLEAQDCRYSCLILVSIQ